MASVTADSPVKPGAFWGTRLLSIVLALAFCFGIGAMEGSIPPFAFRILVLAGLYVTLSVSLNLINGITGQFSIGHAAFYQVGAYVTGFLTINYFDGQPLTAIPWLVIMMIAGAAGAGIVGLMVGLPSLRLRGDYLAIVTLGFGEIISIVTRNQKALGGSYGMQIEPKIQAPWLVWLLAIICIAVCRNLIKTAHGLPFLAVREDEVASSAMGVNTTKTKVTAFVIGSAFAGAAGALYGHFESFITPDMFKMEVSFIILTMVVIGGTGSITGSTLAALFLFGLPEWLRTLKGADGNALQIPAPQVIAALFGVVVFVACARWVRDRYHEKGMKLAGAYGSAVGIAVVASLLFRPLAALIPSMAETSWEINSLRMVIFAVTLVVVMLLRPEGVLGHHEFSWAWLRSLFNKKNKEVQA
jgi:branched-chain amino acid transport system permease protein